MVDSELLQILVCPDTKEPVSLADADLLGRVNEAINAGKLRTQAGEIVTDAVEEGLIREDGRILYPVREGIPIMLIDEGISTEGLG